MKKIISIVLLLFSTSLYAQWNEINFPFTTSPAMSTNLYESQIQILGNDTIYYRMNSTNTGYLTTNGGTSWVTLRNERRFFGNNSRICRVVRDSLFYSTDRGQNWTLRSTNNPTRSLEYKLFDGDVMMRNDISFFYDVGYRNDMIQKSIDSGSTWQSINLPSYFSGNDHIVDIQYLSPEKIYFVKFTRNSSGSRNNDTLFYTANGGTNWNHVSFSGIQYFGHYNSKYKPFQDSLIFISEWGYLNKFNLNTGVGDTIFSQYGLDRIGIYKDVILAICTTGGYNKNNNHFISEDFGDNWNATIDSNMNSTSWFTHIDEVELSNKYYGVALSYYGAIFVYHDERCLEKNFLIAEDKDCFTGKIDLSDYSLYDSIIWNDGKNEKVKLFNYGDTIYATAYSSFCGNISDTIFVPSHIPPALPSLDTTLCGSEISINVKNKNSSIAKQIWSTGDSLSSTLFTQSGIYWVEYTDSNKCSNRDTFAIVLNPTPILDNSLETTLCGSEISINVKNKNSSIAKQIWSTGDSLSSALFTQSGIYWVEYTDSNECSNRDTFAIVLNPTPILDNSLDTTLCGSEISINVKNKNSSIAKQIWSTGDSLSSALFTQSGIYWVEYTDSNECSNRDTFAIVLYPIPVLDKSLDSALCLDTLEIDIRGNNLGLMSYMWSTGDTTSYQIFTQSDIYWVEYTDSNKCSNRDTFAIFLYGNSTLTVGLDTLICGDSLLLDLSFLNNRFDSFLWSTGDTTSTVTLSSSGAYWLQATDSNNCVASDTMKLKLHAPPEKPIIYRNGDTLYTNSSSSLKHIWILDGNVLQNEDDSMVYGVNYGIYTVSVIDKEGCASESSDSLLYTVGITRLSGNTLLQIFPNPNQGKFNVVVKNGELGVERIVIYDLQGKVIFEEKISQYLKDKTIDLTAFRPSMYQLIILRTDGIIETHKIIKQ